MTNLRSKAICWGCLLIKETSVFTFIRTEEQVMVEKKIKILIVDDEVDFLDSTATRLETRGFKVFKAENGEEAIDCAENNPIDIALVDLKMPGISGEETLKRLKKSHQWMEIVILTGHGSVNSAVACLKSGAYEYLQKPCDLNMLLDVLVGAYKKKVMNKHQIAKKKMDDLLDLSIKSASSPLEILNKLKDIENEGTTG
jgi:DNA-binding NtrC family response regulator